MSLRDLDALCLESIVSDAPITFSYAGTDYTGTTGSRDSMAGLMEGGYVSKQDIQILVPVAVFTGSAPPAENATVAVCLDVNGIPCSRADSVSTINAKVEKVARSAAGLTYTLLEAHR